MFGQIVEFNDFMQKINEMEKERKELIDWYKKKVEMISARKSRAK